jgi:hypothetical protein
MEWVFSERVLGRADPLPATPEQLTIVFTYPTAIIYLYRGGAAYIYARVSPPHPKTSQVLLLRMSSSVSTPIPLVSPH